MDYDYTDPDPACTEYTIRRTVNGWTNDTVPFDDKGNLLFSESDITKLGQKNAMALDRIYDKVISFNLIDDKDIQEVAKN